MSTNVADGLLAEALRQPWMITEDGLARILSVLQRTNIGPEALALREGDPVPRRAMTIRPDGTAIIPVVGPIIRRAFMFSRVSGLTDLEMLRGELLAAQDSGAVSRIMLAIDSPGGETTGITELASYIRETDARKPVVAFIEGLGASAAYYLAAAAREIIAAPMGIAGSIGVRMAVRKSKDPAGVATFDFVSSQSPKKRLDPESAEGATEIQQLMDDLAAVFIRDVATYRGVSEETVLSDFGQGGVMAADRALAAGLIDRVETQEAALARLAASVPPSPAERAGTTRRTTATSSAHAPQEEPVKILHRAPEAGAEAGGSGAAGAPAAATPATPTPDAVAAALTAERARIVGLCTVARVTLPTELKAAIEGGHDVGAFAIALAERQAQADAAGADVHRAAATAAEAAAKAAVPQTPAIASGNEIETPEAARTRALRESAARQGLLATTTQDGAQ